MTHLRRWIPACLLVAACSSDPAAPQTVADASVTDAPAADLGQLTDLGNPVDVAAAVDAPVAVDVPTAIDVPAAVDVPAGVSPYPDGPYGNRMGNVLANLSWEGYVNPTGEVVSNTLPYTMTSLQALRGSGRGYALVHVSEFL